MRLVSLATFIGVALLPAANARPACRPNKPTTTSGAHTTTATTADAIETLSTDTATAGGTTATSATSAFISTFDTTIALETTATSDITSVLETTLTESATTTLESTTVISSTTTTKTTTETITTAVITASTEATTTTADASTTTDATTTTTEAAITTTEAATTTTEAATTTTQAAEPSNYVNNGDFETVPNTAWTVAFGEIQDDTSKSHSPSHYANFDLTGQQANQVPYLEQIIGGLSMQRRYRFELYTTVFSSPSPIVPSGTTCTINTFLGSMPGGSFDMDFNTLNAYQPHSFEFTPIDTMISVQLSLRCVPSQEVTFSIGIDDISIMDIGPDLQG